MFAAVKFHRGALLFAVMLIATGVFRPAAGVDPTAGVEYQVVGVRWGAGVAATGAGYASVVVNRVNFERVKPQRFPGEASYVCLVLGNRSMQLTSYGCDEAPVAAKTDQQAANATGSLRAALHRIDTGKHVGWTTLRYDLRWTATTSATPRLHAGAAACPPLPWAGWNRATGGATAEMISFGWAVGTVSSSTLGTVRYSESSMPWPGTLVDSTRAASSYTDPLLPTVPSRAPLDARCFGVEKNLPLIPTL
jgi:hypothetical protein